MVCSWKMESALNYEVLKKAFFDLFVFCVYDFLFFLTNLNIFFFLINELQRMGHDNVFCFFSQCAHGFHHVSLCLSTSILRVCGSFFFSNHISTFPSTVTHLRYSCFSNIFVDILLPLPEWECKSDECLSLQSCFFKVHKTERWAMSITLKLPFKIHLTGFFLRSFLWT